MKKGKKTLTKKSRIDQNKILGQLVFPNAGIQGGEEDRLVGMEEYIRRARNNRSPACWQLLTLCPRTQASQAHFSPLISMVAVLCFCRSRRLGLILKIKIRKRSQNTRCGKKQGRRRVRCEERRPTTTTTTTTSTVWWEAVGIWDKDNGNDSE